MPVPGGVAEPGCSWTASCPAGRRARRGRGPALSGWHRGRPDGGSLYGLYVVLGLTWWWAVSEAGAARGICRAPGGGRAMRSCSSAASLYPGRRARRRARGGGHSWAGIAAGGKLCGSRCGLIGRSRTPGSLWRSRWPESWPRQAMRLRRARPGWPRCVRHRPPRRLRPTAGSRFRSGICCLAGTCLVIRTCTRSTRAAPAASAHPRGRRAAAGAPDWSPGGAKIVYESDQTGDYRIWAMNADGSGQRRLTDDPGFADLLPRGLRMASASCSAGAPINPVASPAIWW